MNTVFTRHELEMLHRAAVKFLKDPSLDDSTVLRVEAKENLRGAIRILDKVRGDMNRYKATHCLASPTAMGKEDW